jgi:predicted GIY-YIG superfamily endonuclease
MELRSEDGRYYLYILTNRRSNLLKVMVTGDWIGKLRELEYGLFNKPLMRDDYNVLLYWEDYDDPLQVIQRQQEITNWSKRKKHDLISRHNPGWNPLNEKY